MTKNKLFLNVIFSAILKRFCLFGFFSIVAFSTDLSAQDEFAKGFIVSNTQDTIHGFLKEEMAVIGYNIHFKKTKDGIVDVYNPNMLKEFYLSTGELYETNQIEVNEEKKNVFLKCVIKGAVSFYSYTDDHLHKRFYIKTEQNGMRELDLIKTKKFDEKAGAYYESVKKPYIGELVFALKDCPLLRDRIKECSFTEKKIAVLVVNYHECTNKEYIEYKKKRKLVWSKPEFGILFGVNKRYKTKIIEASNSYGTNISPFVNIYLPNSRNRYSLEVRYAFNKIGIGDEIIESQSIPIRFNRYYLWKNNRVTTKIGLEIKWKENRSRTGPILGLGYNFRIHNFRIISNVEYRFLHTKILYFNLGVSFQNNRKP